MDGFSDDEAPRENSGLRRLGSRKSGDSYYPMDNGYNAGPSYGMSVGTILSFIVAGAALAALGMSIFSIVHHEKYIQCECVHGSADNPGCCGTDILFTDNLEDFEAGPNTTFQYYYFTNGVTLADDGVATYNDTKGCLNIDSSEFTLLWTVDVNTSFGVFDHAKYIVFRNETFTLPTNGKEFVFEADIASIQTIGNIPDSIQPGITNPKSDPRIAVATLEAIDFSSWMLYAFGITDETLYAAYERLPYGKPSYGGAGPDYHSFTHAIPLAKRNVDDPLNDFRVVSIAVNKAEDYVRYLIDGVEYYRINNLGYPISRQYRILDGGGPSTDANQSFINVGFGHLTILDAENPVRDTSLLQATETAGSNDPSLALLQLGLASQYNNAVLVDPTTGDAIPETFLSVNATDRLFGNGMTTCIKYLKAYHENPF